jgi:hypothetical protein
MCVFIRLPERVTIRSTSSCTKTTRNEALACSNMSTTSSRLGRKCTRHPFLKYQTGDCSRMRASTWSPLLGHAGAWNLSRVLSSLLLHTKNQVVDAQRRSRKCFSPLVKMGKNRKNQVWGAQETGGGGDTPTLGSDYPGGHPQRVEGSASNPFQVLRGPRTRS